MSDEAEKAISAEADARYPRLTADRIRANRALLAAPAWGRASRDAEVVDAWKHADEGAEYTIRSLREQLDSVSSWGNDEHRAFIQRGIYIKQLRDQLAARDALVESQARQIEKLLSNGAGQDERARIYSPDWWAGRASRDAEVAELRTQLACYSDQEDRIQYLAEQLAEAERTLVELKPNPEESA